MARLSGEYGGSAGVESGRHPGEPDAPAVLPNLRTPLLVPTSVESGGLSAAQRQAVRQRLFLLMSCISIWLVRCRRCSCVRWRRLDACGRYAGYLRMVGTHGS